MTRKHKCPTCGVEEECDIVVYSPGQRHSCRHCGSTWNEKGVVQSGGGEAK